MGKNTDKHKAKLEKFMQDMVRKGYMYELCCRLDTREIAYDVTEKGKRMGVGKKLKGF